MREESDLNTNFTESENTDWAKESMVYAGKMVASQDPVDQRLLGLIKIRQNHRVNFGMMKELKQELLHSNLEQIQPQKLRQSTLKQCKMSAAEVQLPRRAKTAWLSNQRNKVFTEPSNLDQIREESQVSRPTEENCDQEQYDEVKRELDHLTELGELSSQHKSKQDQGVDASFLQNSSLDYAISARPRKSFRDLNDI